MNQSVNQIRISFKELPARARELKPNEISAVFGGCIQQAQSSCVNNCDCCDTVPFGYMLTCVTGICGKQWNRPFPIQ
jgi:hypothetical protein